MDCLSLSIHFLMKIEFVSHAGFITEVNGKRIFSDPWTTGKVFNDSWALYAKAADVDYKSINYIFVSHEHPDHFNFPTLKGIPAELRKQITVLYQKHSSRRLYDTFMKLGFAKVIELPIYRWTQVEGIDLYCGSAGSMDSFLAVRFGGKTLLNLNDCIFKSHQYKYIRSQLKKIDVLFTQFSFANFVGNEKDEFDNAGKKIRDIREQIEVFHPEFTVPFASFVYFCNPENSRMNGWSNTPQKIDDLNIPTLNFMYPGDTVELENPHFQSKQAVARYMKDMSVLTIDTITPAVPFEEVTQAITENLTAFRDKVLLPFRLLTKPFGVYIHDLDKAVLIDPRRGLFASTVKDDCRFVMSSQVCWYTFKYSWGTGTLTVSGMYLDRELDKPDPKYFFFQNLISTAYISFRTPAKAARTLLFFWRKKWELFYRWL